VVHGGEEVGETKINWRFGTVDCHTLYIIIIGTNRYKYKSSKSSHHPQTMSKRSYAVIYDNLLDVSAGEFADVARHHVAVLLDVGCSTPQLTD
jgi:hypothetical protein